jgi:hypothetical protein
MSYDLWVIAQYLAVSFVLSTFLLWLWNTQ